MTITELLESVRRVEVRFCLSGQAGCLGDVGGGSLMLKPEFRNGTGARPPRAQFSAPSRETRAHGKVPSVLKDSVRNVLNARARPATPGAGVCLLYTSPSPRD